MSRKNKFKKMVIAMYIFIFSGISFFSINSCYALEIFNRSSTAVEYGFDLMETFDDIQDWTGSARMGKSASVISSPDFPKRIDGSDTPFNAYDYWVPTDPGNDFITDHRSHGGQIWDPNGIGVGKSVSIDMSHRGIDGLGDGVNRGPSRFGTYFGSTDGVNGDKTYGYTEMYVFYMVYMPKNWFPTYIDLENNRLGTYVEGDLYSNDATTGKHQTMAHGFIRPWQHWEGPGSGNPIEYLGANSTYGWFPNVSQWAIHDNQPKLRMGDISDYLDNTNPTAHPCCDEYNGDNVGNGYGSVIPTDQWVGMEVRYKFNSNPLISDGEKSLWWYENDGTEHHIQTITDLFAIDSCHYANGDKMNFFFIGGNNSATWLWGDGMVSAYYVDDFIINSSRIGPTYFAKKIGGEILDTTPPSRSAGLPTGTLTAGTTSATLSLTTNESATCKYSSVSGTAYASITEIFTTTGATSHSIILSGLTNGNSYNYYVRCSDVSNNVNTDDYEISFSVQPTSTTYNLTNFISAITNWLQIGNETSDVNSDGVVNTRDLGTIMSNWSN